MPACWRVAVASVATLLAASTTTVSCGSGAGRDENTPTNVETAMAVEAAKPRFTGTLGDFLILPLDAQGRPETTLLRCANGGPTRQLDRRDPALRAHELWSPAFDVPEGAGWACSDGSIIVVNNQGMEGATSDGSFIAMIRMYFTSLPLNVVRDAPRDRLDLIDVEGHAGLLERPIKGYPYALSSVIVVERRPDGDMPGIVAIIERARSAEDAVRLAEQVMP